MDTITKIVTILQNRSETISAMESATGGMLASEITNVSGSSDVLKCSLVTYCNDFKIKFGVDASVIDTYTVYSNQTSMEMARNVCEFANSTWGIGITGQLGILDPENLGSKNNEVYYTIYSKRTDTYFNDKITVAPNLSRKQKKEKVIKKIAEDFLNLLESSIK